MNDLNTTSPRVALVHDWLDSDAGAEKVLALLAARYPKAPIYVLVANPDLVANTDWLKTKTIHTSFIQRLPGSPKRFRWYLPLMPLAIEQFDLSSYDIVISSSHAVAKGVIVGPDQYHICYMHSPMRYAWDMQHQVLAASGMASGLKSLVARWVLHYLRLWDTQTIRGVDYLLVNSHYVSRRSRRVYGQEGHVLHPPVDTAFFKPLEAAERKGFVAASRLVPYKRMDILVRAFYLLPDCQLTVVGDGPERKRLEAMAPSNVTFVGRLSKPLLREQLQHAQAFLFAAEEDFGILPVEAMACGCPVVAFGRGGVLESVVAEGAKKTGAFFYRQEPDAVVSAINRCVELTISEQACVDQAQRFTEQAFLNGWDSVINAIQRPNWTPTSTVKD